MGSVEIIFWILFALLSAMIVYQDLKTRLIDLWILLAYTLVLVSFFFMSGHSKDEFITNLSFTVAYCLFCYLMLHLYYFLKTGSFVKMMDNRLGCADVWVLITAGLVTDMVSFINVFIVAAFLCLIYFTFKKRKKTIPFAGFYVMVILVYQVFSWFYPNVV